MAKVINMQRVVPEVLAFDMGDGRIYRMSSAISVQKMLTFAKLEAELVRFQEEAAALQAADDLAALEAAGERIVEVLQELCDEILDVLRVLSPDLEECPFDQEQVGVFLATLRGHFEDSLGPDPTPPSPQAGTTKTPANRAARRRSTPSSGSRASASSSAGRRTTGGG